MSTAANGNDPSEPRAARGIGPAIALLFAIVVMLATGRAAAGVVDPALEARFAAAPPGAMLPVIVVLDSQARPAAAARAPGLDRLGRRRAVMQSLLDIAARTQPPVLAHLAQEESSGHARKVKAFWIFNGFAVTATEGAIRRLAARADVREIRFDAAIPAPQPVPAAVPAPTPTSEAVWNIAKIRAPDVWGLDPAYNGTGVVVGSFDTGVDVTHPDLAPRYRGNDAISWFDPYGEHASPYDNNGHGTHTTGTAVGGDASGFSIGVAPGAQWIAAKAWDDSDNATISAFHEIFQWFLAPGGDPANAPDVINDSWGVTPATCYPDFLPDVQALRAAGILPVFSSGNEGPAPSSAIIPGAYAESFSVGATDELDDIADFSSRGPSSCDGEIKPDISAPGVSVLSSIPGGWFELDGTSMAAPHVTGAAAVLRSIDPSLTIDDIESALVLGAVDLGAPGADNDYGVGRLDLLESARIVIGKPLLGVAATTPKAYEAGTVPGVFTVSREGDTSADLAVTYTVSGTATSGADYAPLSGSVVIPAGAASAAIAVTPVDDTELEYDETVVVRLGANPAYLVAPAQATVTIVSDELFPDLVVSNLAAPSTAGAGLVLAVSETTRNQGAGPAPSASTTTYYLSSDTVVDGADIVLGARSVAALAPGASDTASVPLTIPAATATGTWYLIAQADSADVVPETSNTNNTAVRTLFVGPDLLPYAVSVPASAGAGTTISVTDTTKNQGGGPAAASTTAFYLSTDSVLDAADVALGSRAVPALAPGALDTATTSLAIPPATATGAYYLITKVDSGSAVAETSETNNTTLRTLSIGGDLVVSSLTVPSTAGAGFAMTLSDTTKNQGGGAVPASTTTYYLSTSTTLDGSAVALGSRAVPALAAGASDTGTVSLVVPAGTATGPYHVIVRADAGDAVSESSETNNTAVRSVSIGPDLTVSTMTVPATVGAGATISISDTTKNQGGGAAGASTTRFYLSSDAVLDAADALLGSRAVAALAPGASDTGTASLAIPAGTATGSYYLIARADASDAIVETTETNNTTLRAFTIGADLVISSVAAPATAGAGLAIAVTDTTKNQGGGAAPATTTTFYLSANSTLEPGDVVLGSRAIAALAAGASDTGSMSLAIPAGTAAGTWYLIAKADAGDALAETQENNNTYGTTISIGPDLAVSALTIPQSAGAGLAISVSDTTKNQGGGPAPASTTTYYLSSDTTVDAGDAALGSRAVAALAPGAADSGSLTVTIPAGTAPGTWYVVARADAGDAVGETSETNNTYSRLITIGPDLAVSALTVPAAAAAGAAITVSDTTKNQGSGAAPSSATSYYLSSDTSLDAGDVALGSRAVAALAPGASDAGSATLTIPAATPGGTYYLIAKADGGDAVAETQEGNNTAFRTLAIGANLVVSALTVPTSAGAGLPITVSDTTKNQGGGAAAASTTSYYLSANTLLDGADVLLGSRSVGALAPSASSSGSATFTVPAATATGSYYVIARADSGDAVGETSEADNTALRPIAIGPDLAVSALTVPATVAAGAAISVTDTTKNQGAGAAPATTTRFYLSADVVLDGADALLGSRSVAALAPGGSDTGSVTLAIPAGTASGTYYLIAKADGDDALAETQEGNNTAQRTVTIGADLVVSALSAPAAAGAGTAIAVSDTTKNQGGSAAAASTTSYYLSANSALDGADLALGSRAVGALAPGASDTGSVALAIPAGTATGVYYVIARADSGDAVAETSEANNTSSRSISIGPDLAVSALTAPASAAAGAAISVSDTTRNQGAGAAPATTTTFYLSANVVLDGADAVIGSRSVAPLAPAASDAGSATVTIPAGTASGTYYLIAKADGGNTLAETQEGNNTAFRVISIGADLVVSTLAAPAAAGAGTTIAVSDTTRNQGGGAAAASTTTYYLSANSALDGADLVLGSRPVAALAAGASDSGSATLDIPAGTATGTYYLIASADSGGVVDETSEGNNTTLRMIAIGPDLAVGALTAPASAAAGAAISVSDTTRNQGAGAAPATTTTFYLSANVVLDGADLPLGSRPVAALAAGATDSGSATLTIPPGTAPGNWYLIAKADGGDALAETQENNNAYALLIKVTSP